MMETDFRGVQVVSGRCDKTVKMRTSSHLISYVNFATPASAIHAPPIRNLKNHQLTDEKFQNCQCWAYHVYNIEDHIGFELD